MRDRSTVVLLTLAAVCRAAVVPLPQDGPLSVLWPALTASLVGAAVPAALAVAHGRGRRGVGAGTVTLAAAAAGALVTAGTMTLSRPDAQLTPGLWMVAALLELLAGATVVARWQDDSAPVAGLGSRPLRAVTMLAALYLALGAVDELTVATTTAGVEVARRVALFRLGAALAVIGPTAWAVTRRDPVWLAWTSAVLGTAAIGQLLEEVSFGRLLGTPELWPMQLALGVVAVLLLAVVPAWAGRRRAQATSVSA